jgi:hypothetical protein
MSDFHPAFRHGDNPRYRGLIAFDTRYEALESAAKLCPKDAVWLATRMAFRFESGAEVLVRAIEDPYDLVGLEFQYMDLTGLTSKHSRNYLRTRLRTAMTGIEPEITE